MYLKQQKRRNGRVYLSIVEGYREDGKVKTRHVKSLGYLDELAKRYDDPVGHFRAELARMEHGDGPDVEPDGESYVRLAPQRKLRPASNTMLHLGAVLPRTYFYRELGIGRFFERLHLTAELGCDPARVLEMLVWHRISQLSSKRMGFEEIRRSFPLDRRITPEQVARTLSFIVGHQDNLTDWIAQSLHRSRESALKANPYYALTRYYFRLDPEDAGFVPGGSDASGPSAPESPLVHLGLLNDADGIPIDYELRIGPDGQALLSPDTMERLHAKCPQGRLTVLANSAAHMGSIVRMCLEQGNDFVLSQNIATLSANTQAWLFSRDGYDSYDDGKLLVKSLGFDYPLPAGTGAEGDTLRVRSIGLWSAHIASQYGSLRAKWLQRSLSLMTAGEGVSLAGALGDAELQPFLLGETNQAARNDPDAVLDPSAIDWAQLERGLLPQGHRFLITNRIDAESRRIVSDYQGLDRLYDLFDLYKTDIYYDPALAGMDRIMRVRAHFLVSYIAVAVMRLMQIDTDWNYSQRLIADALCSVVGHRIDANHFLFDYRTRIVDTLSKAAGLDLTNQVLTRGQIRKLMAQASNPQPHRAARRAKKKRTVHTLEESLVYNVGSRDLLRASD